MMTVILALGLLHLNAIGGLDDAPKLIIYVSIATAGSWDLVILWILKRKATR